MTVINADFLKRTNLYIVGMMGAGKTTIGRQLANRLGYRFLDTDAIIEQTAGKPITDLFAQAGEAAFRKLETQALSEVSTHTNLVVATGGGIVTQQMNWSYLRHGVVIWLDVPTPVLVSRLSDDTSRPLLHNVDLGTKLDALMIQRTRLYRQADIHIPYEGHSVEEICDHIIANLKENIRPDPQQAAGQITVSQASINPPVLKNP